MGSEGSVSVGGLRWSLRRLGGICQGRGPEVRLQRPRHPRVRSPSHVSNPTRHPQVRMEFDYDGGGIAKGGDVSLFYDGSEVGGGGVEATQAMIFSADETTDIGYEFRHDRDC